MVILKFFLLAVEVPAALLGVLADEPAETAAVVLPVWPWPAPSVAPLAPVGVEAVDALEVGGPGAKKICF